MASSTGLVLMPLEARCRRLERFQGVAGSENEKAL